MIQICMLRLSEKQIYPVKLCFQIANDRVEQIKYKMADKRMQRRRNGQVRSAKKKKAEINEKA